MSSIGKPGLTWLELAIPFTLRAVFLFYLAPLFLALNIKGLAVYNIHLCSLLDCRPLQPKRLAYIFLKLVVFFLLPCIFVHCLFIFGGFAVSTEKPIVFWEPSLIASLSIFSTVIILIIPLEFFYKAERMMLVSGLKRVIFDGFQSSVSFSDVLLGDVLTSYSRVLGDFFNFTYQSFSLPLSQENSILASDIVTPLIISLPFFFRLRQCVAEFLASGCSNQRHIMNALKYATAFPVVFLSPLVSKYVLLAPTEGSGAKGDILFDSTWLYYSWIFFVVLNSIYSFFWDVLMDWDLGHFFPWEPTYFAINNQADVFSESSNLILEGEQKSYFSKTKWFLRKTLHFSSPWLYYVMVLLNLLLRISWTIKLSRKLDIYHAPFGDFLLEFLELLRRFIWVFFRLEKELIFREAESSPAPSSFQGITSSCTI